MDKQKGEEGLLLFVRGPVQEDMYYEFMDGNECGVSAPEFTKVLFEVYEKLSQGYVCLLKVENMDNLSFLGLGEANAFKEEYTKIIKGTEKRSGFFGFLLDALFRVEDEIIPSKDAYVWLPDIEATLLNQLYESKEMWENDFIFDHDIIFYLFESMETFPNLEETKLLIQQKRYVLQAYLDIVTHYITYINVKNSKIPVEKMIDTIKQVGIKHGRELVLQEWITPPKELLL